MEISAVTLALRGRVILDSLSAEVPLVRLDPQFSYHWPDGSSLVVPDGLEAAEARVRQEIDRQTQPLIQDARGRVEQVRTGAAQQVSEQLQQIQELRKRLEARLRALPGRAGIPG